MRLLVDTNVFLDVFLNRKDLADISQYFFCKAKTINDQIIVCATTLKDIAYFLMKVYHDSNKVNGMLIELYYEVDKVVGLTVDDTIKAIHMDGDFEDNLIINTCQSNSCDIVITNNLKDFKDKGIKIMSPLQYLENLKWIYEIR